MKAEEAAIRHVAALATGEPMAPGLRVTLNFHPDREGLDGRPILVGLAEDGLYRSQFVTGTSNGGLTAYPGGARWAWESRIFGGAYDDAPPHVRPVYGALNFRAQSVGAAPRFGSAHFRLGAGALERTTFCYPDSAAEPESFGVASAMALIDLALADGAPADEAPADDGLADGGPAGAGAPVRDALDGYIEAQVHGPVELARDVEALVLDPCYRGTEVEQAARLLPCPLEWHPGFRLDVRELRRHPDYRGPRFVELGARIAQDGRLDPRVVGDAVRTGRYDPQALKRVWHYVARFGAPTASTTPGPVALGDPGA